MLRSIDRCDYEVHLYGNGDREWLSRAFAGVRGEVRIEGWLGGQRKLDELARAAAMVAPSRAEGFGTALVEAHAAGTPVIATAVGGVAEAVRGYVACWLVAGDGDEQLRQAVSAVLDGDWPPARSTPADLPPELCSEVAVQRLVEIYATITG